VNRKTLVTSILKMLTIALLRRWLRVQVLVNPVSFFSSFSTGQSSLDGS
jgi:hypothetical protein